MRKAVITSVIVSTLITGVAMLINMTGGARDWGPDVKRLYDQVQDLQEKTDRLEEKLTRTRFELEALQAAADSGGDGGDIASRMAAAAAAAEVAAGRAAPPEEDQRSASERRADLLNSDGLAAAAISALEDRAALQKRLLFVLQPACRKPDAEGQVICEINIRNNAGTATSVSFSQSGTSVSIAGGDTFSAIRMRQPGQRAFAYTTALTIPAESNGAIEVAFGPVAAEAEEIRSFSLAANKLIYSFETIPLN